ncbi:MAG TPA: BLUF domain-containing protein [Acidobacteriaceae bacterium]
MPFLSHLMYASVATAPLDADGLKDLLKQSRAFNKLHSITGMLLYSDNNFFQVIEGPRTAIEALFQTILRDKRHTQVTLIIQEPISRRYFDDWSMGFSNIPSVELAGIDGLTDFFKENTYLTSLDAGRAKKLLTAFAEGRWRATLTGPKWKH